MAHPEAANIEQRLAREQEVQSDLMRAKKRARGGQKVNACPYGCADEELDDHGYCRHLVGFTADGVVMEPFTVPDEMGRRHVLGSRPEPVQKGDKLVRITTTSRVYRNPKGPVPAKE